MSAEFAADAVHCFDDVELKIAKGRPFSPVGILEAGEDLEEIEVLAAGRPRKTAVVVATEHRLRAFAVRTSRLTGYGLLPGDHVLVEERDNPHPDSLLVIRIGGRYVVRKHASLLFDVRVAPQILGAVIGIVRRRGFKRSSPLDDLPAMHVGRPVSKARILQGQLGMLESTCATTHNVRLQRALRLEAEHVRQQLQSGAIRDKPI